MWPGAVAFYTNVLEGDIGGFWRQHVSHRIVFSNILYFIDGAFFGGSFKFLLVMHFVLMGMIATLFYYILRLDPQFSPRRTVDFCVLVLVIAFSFSWIQWRNITWPFQSPMFLASLIPATALVLLYQSSRAEKSTRQRTRFFAWSLVAGLCAPFTMMNGILTLPLMILLGLALRIPMRRLALIAVAAVLILFVFFYGYEKSEYETSFLGTLLNEPDYTFYFAFSLLGAPLHYALNDPFLQAAADVDLRTAFACGLGMALLLLLLTVQLVYQPDTRDLGLLFLALLLYVAATIGAIATGRQGFGINQALESRYMTNVLFAWSICLIMLRLVVWQVKPMRYAFYGGLMGSVVVLADYQKIALERNTWPRWIYHVGALAVELEVKDPDTIRFVYPETDPLFFLTEKAREADLSVFGHPLFKGLREQVGAPYPEPPQDVPACELSQQTFRAVPAASDWFALSGVLFADPQVPYPARFSILSEDGTLIGYSMTEMSAYLPLREPLSHATWTSGFVRAPGKAQTLILTSPGYSCRYDFPGLSETE